MKAIVQERFGSFEDLNLSAEGRHVEIKWAGQGHVVSTLRADADPSCLTRNSVPAAIVEVSRASLVPSTAICLRFWSRSRRPCASVSAVASNSRLKSSLRVINWRFSSATRPRNLVSVARTGCSGCCCGSSGRTGDNRTASSSLPQSYGGIAAPSRAIGAGRHGHGGTGGLPSARRSAR
jgi:hypothetical protein